MSAPGGFHGARRRGGGEVAITHRGRPAAALRGDRAAAFLRDVEGLDEGARRRGTARLAGNHRRCDGRPTRRHPRDA